MAEFIKFTGDRTTKAAATREARTMAEQDGVICWDVQDNRPVIYMSAEGVHVKGLPDGWTIVERDPAHFAKCARAQKAGRTRSASVAHEKAYRAELVAALAGIGA